MTTYTDKHREYYVKNRQRILSLRRDRERRWLETPEGKYSVHKRSARKRKVEFLLSFDEWWKIWQDSGKWQQRGSGADQYCMCRTNDVGPYAVGNVRIDTISANSLENYTARGVDNRGRFI